MNKILITILAIVGLVLLSICCINKANNKIKSDILTRSNAIVSDIDGFDGSIEVDGFDVSLNGTVNSEEVKLKIEQLVGSESGIRNIFNNLVVELPKGLSIEVLNIIQNASDKILEFKNIEFQTNTAIVLNSNNDIFENAVKIFNDNPDMHVEVSGHTDSVGDKDYNIALSQRRADAVLEKLVDYNISRNRLTAVGYGSSQGIADNRTIEGQQKNRRVEFNVKENK